jgi:hypothetical protein
MDRRTHPTTAIAPYLNLCLALETRVMSQPAWKLALLAAPFLVAGAAGAAEPLHVQIDKLIAAKISGQPTSPQTDDAEFVRRVYLDLAGRIPSVAEARAFLDDKAPDKRTKLIDQLLAAPSYPKRMADLFHVFLMERLGDHADWTKYLRTAFEANRPWDQMARDILKGDADSGAAFFYAKRLENYGQNPVDYPALTRDVGRLFLGVDLRCAQCHDHLFIDEYKQEHFQGLFAFFQNTALADPKKAMVSEKLMTRKLDFMSVFKKVPKETGPRVPGLPEIEIPVLKKGEEYVKPPDPKTRTPGVPRFSPLALLSEQLPQSPAFGKNMANRLWFFVMGRGLVHPLDLHHKENKPSHPELLDLLAQEFAAHQYDMKWLLRELAMTQTYQRSTVLPAGVTSVPPESYRTVLEKRLSAEQLLASMLTATGEKAEGAALTALETKFVKAFANPRREPEEEFNPSLKAALFVLNDDTVLTWLAPKPGNLVERLTKLKDDQVADELFLGVLTRSPTAEEKAEIAGYLAKNSGERRPTALGQLAWALLAATEFCVNH